LLVFGDLFGKETPARLETLMGQGDTKKLVSTF
jgi:hypothetical protein